MPRQSQAKLCQDFQNPSFPDPTTVPPPTIAGRKRDAAAISTSTANELRVQCDPTQACLRLPAKSKENERLIHIQRWINHVGIDDDTPPPSTSSTSSSQRSSSRRWYRDINEERELTPPPGHRYSARAPITLEESRLFSLSYPQADAYNATATRMNAAVPYQYPSQQQPQPISSPHQEQRQEGPPQATNNHNQQAGRTEPSRFFQTWETKLIIRLFGDFLTTDSKSPIPGRLPSLGEIRHRIARSRLEESRTPTAIRAKIKRMQCTANNDGGVGWAALL